MENEKPSFGVNACVQAHAQKLKPAAKKQANIRMNELYFVKIMSNAFSLSSLLHFSFFFRMVHKSITYTNISIRKVCLSENLNALVRTIIFLYL